MRPIYKIAKMLIMPMMLIFSQHAWSSVYIAAHPDDIELFMNVNASNDVYRHANTVFILTTAGDGGYANNIGVNVQGVPYYRGRLWGHERAIRYWQSLDGLPLAASIHTTETVLGHTIEKVAFGNVVMYNLNLPDGDYYGEGYAADGYQSLARLLNGSISSITSIDGINHYTLSDLQQTILQLISLNNRGTGYVWANIQDEDPTYNPNDHSDHTSTALLVLGAISTNTNFSCVNIGRFQDYVISGEAINETIDQQNIHAGTWGALNSGLVDYGNPNSWDQAHLGWLGRQYWRGVFVDKTCTF